MQEQAVDMIAASSTTSISPFTPEGNSLMMMVMKAFAPSPSSGNSRRAPSPITHTETPMLTMSSAASMVPTVAARRDFAEKQRI